MAVFFDTITVCYRNSCACLASYFSQWSTCFTLVKNCFHFLLNSKMSPSNTLKWKKYNLLAQLGFTPLIYLKDNIFIYPIEKLNILIDDVYSYFLHNLENKVLVVIKFLELDKPGQLLNFRLTHLPEKNDLRTKIQANTTNSIVEYWFCCSQVSNNPDNFSGRYLFNLIGEVESDEIIEIVWWTSPRIIETDQAGTEFPLARFSRKFPSRTFTIDLIPDHRFNISDESLNFCLTQILGLFRRKSRSIALFQKVLLTHKFNTFSLEFKFESGKGHFIDWDTYNDKHILNIFYNSL